MSCPLNLPPYMLNMPSRIRQEKLAIAQSRAMEEQRERVNPLAHRGAGATPSMGLSQYRGGMESDSEDEVGGIVHRRMVGEGFFDTLKGAVSGVAQQVAADPVGSFKKAKAGYDLAQSLMGKGYYTDKADAFGALAQSVMGKGKRGKRALRSMDEATAMGLHLGKHLHGLHGDDFLQKFGAGMVGAAMMCEGRGMSGAGFFDDLKHAFSPQVWDPQQNGVAQAFNQFGQDVKHEFVDPNSTLRGEVIPMASKVASVVSAIPGVGEALAPVTMAIKAADYANKGAKAVGLGRHKKGGAYGAYEGEGKLHIIHGGRKRNSMSKVMEEEQSVHLPMMAMRGEGWWDDLKEGAKKAATVVASEIARDPQGALDKAKKGYEIGKQVYGAVKGGKKRRAPAGPSDGRRKRAEIVKKVMAEKGLSMIEASKYVKAHGLY